MLPERLKNLRKEASLTQQQLANIVGTTQQNIGFWETGRQHPKNPSLVKLANYFNVTTDYLLGKTDIKNSSDIDEDALEQSLRKSIGFNGKPATDEEIENMKNALIDYLKNH